MRRVGCAAVDGNGIEVKEEKRREGEEKKRKSRKGRSCLAVQAPKTEKMNK
jgi:hypothetical protein